jgi:hypothetical protein
MKRLPAREILYNQKWMMKHAYGYWYKLVAKRVRPIQGRLEFTTGPLSGNHWITQRAREVDYYLMGLREAEAKAVVNGLSTRLNNRIAKSIHTKTSTPKWMLDKMSVVLRVYGKFDGSICNLNTINTGQMINLWC